MSTPLTGCRAFAVPRAPLRLLLASAAVLVVAAVLCGAVLCGAARAAPPAALMDPGQPSQAAKTTGPTVADVVAFTRIVLPANGSQEALNDQVSPDASQVFIVTRKADIRADRNRYQVLLVRLGPEALSDAGLRRPRVLLSLDAADDNNSAYPALQDVRWTGARTLVFLWKPKGSAFQVHKVDTVTGQVTQLSASPMGVVSYALSDDQRRLVYTAPHPNPPLAPGAHSVVVGNQSFWTVKFGQHDLRAQQRKLQYFVADLRSGRAPRATRPLGEPFAEANRWVPRLSISPDGRWALVPRFEPERQLAWGRQYPLVAETTAKSGPALTTDPLGYFSRPGSYVVRRLVAYRLADGREQAVVDAPDDSLPANGQMRTDRLWQDGGRSVVIAGTHLPLPQGAQGLEATDGLRASHVIEYWPDTGRWEVVARLKGRLGEARAVPGQGFVVTDAGQRRHFKRQAGGGWLELAAADGGGQGIAAGEGADAGADQGANEVRGRAWTLRIDEGLNQPPELVADVVSPGAQRRRVQLTELNPQFSATWGTMRPYSWKDSAGLTWQGGLMVPAGFTPGRPQPLVIQTYGFSPTRFYLDGSNTYDGFTSGFAGRAFLREGLLVLAMPFYDTTGTPASASLAIQGFMKGVGGAIDALVAEGLVDRERIGIMGWSATGERVLNQLTFSDAPIRAASIVDGDANTIFSLAVTYAANDGIQARKERTNEGPPFGESLMRWVQNDPALHTDCVSAALRIETYGPWVLNNWDIYALLRRQYKPVEMIVLPDGSHGLMTPSDRMVSLQGNVDWFRFWLQEEQRTVPVLHGETTASLQAQYGRWQQMAELKRADATKPICARKAGATP